MTISLCVIQPQKICTFVSQSSYFLFCKNIDDSTDGNNFLPQKQKIAYF